MELPIGLFEEPNGWRINTEDYSSKRFSVTSYGGCRCAALKAALAAITEGFGGIYRKGFKRFVEEPSSKKQKYGCAGINLQKRLDGYYYFEVSCRDEPTRQTKIGKTANPNTRSYQDALRRAIRYRKQMEKTIRSNSPMTQLCY